MKKFLLSIALLMSVLPVCAVNWEMVDTDIPDLSLYVDTDSLVYINNDEYYYAIRYKEGTKPEKIAYLKANSATNYVGVISTGDYGVDAYRPQVVFKNAHVFMRPVTQNSFLNFANEYLTAWEKPEEVVQTSPTLRDSNIKPVSCVLSDGLKDYVIQTSYALENNWNPPKSGRNTQATIVLSIGVDGSLQNYKFVKSSGDEATDRSIISAVEQSVPFLQFPRSASSVEPANFQFEFDYKWFKKSVH